MSRYGSTATKYLNCDVPFRACLETNHCAGDSRLLGHVRVVREGSSRLTTLDLSVDMHCQTVNG